MSTYAVDTSVVIPLLVASHDRHDEVRAWRAGKRIALSGHTAAESYSVLTRLKDGLRLSAEDAHRALSTGFEPPLPAASDAITRRLADAGVTGGAVHDALVAMAAADAGLTLATLDARALPTYAAVGARVEIAALQRAR